MRESSPLILKLDKSLSDLSNMRANLNITGKMQNLCKCTEGVSSWNCSVCKIDVHLYASIVCDGCLEWDHLKCVGLKAPPKSTYWLYRQCYNKGK